MTKNKIYNQLFFKRIRGYWEIVNIYFESFIFEIDYITKIPKTFKIFNLGVSVLSETSANVILQNSKGDFYKIISTCGCTNIGLGKYVGRKLMSIQPFYVWI